MADTPSPADNSESLAPRLRKPIQHLVILQNRPFKFNLKKYFSSPTSPVEFSLIGAPPSWLLIDSSKGILYGRAPSVAHQIQVVARVEARNEHGSINQHFMITVINSNFFESLKILLENRLTMRNRPYRAVAGLHYQHELLEYIFEYLMASPYAQDVLHALEKAAKKAGRTVTKPISYDEFKEIILLINPGYERELALALEENHLATMATLSNEEFRNLFRQGSQQAGSIVPYVLNELGLADYYIATTHPQYSVNVLHEAAERIITLKEEMQLEQAHRPTPRPFPK